MQTEVNEPRRTNLRAAAAPPSANDQGPQVLVIGEIRDEETANIAVRAALTGHLVISTLHAGSCRGVFERLQIMCADHSAVASATELVVNQRLMRRLCVECSGAGCQACLHTGYRGRMPVMEWLKLDNAMREAIRRCELEGLVPRKTLEQSARELLSRKLTNDTEYARTFGL